MARTIKGRKPTKDELRASVEVRKAEARVRIAQIVVPWTGWSFIAFCVYLSISDLAGHITVADINILAKGIVGTDAAPPCPSWYVVGTALFFGLAGMTLAWKERRLRKSTVEHLHPYQEMWETEHDSKRDSSKLTPRGDTRPEDK